jgi:glutathione S-transferase
MLKLFGVVDTRTFRNAWMLEELGLAYEQVPVEETETRTPAHLAVNPNGHVPVLQDGDFTLVESMAINLYLAAKHGNGLWPATVEDRGRALQWSFWAQLELEGHLETCMNHRWFYDPDCRDALLADRAEDALAQPLGVLNDALAGRPHLLGDAFTVADLNVAAVVSWARFGLVSLSDWPAVSDWLGGCLGRPARRAATAKGPRTQLDLIGKFRPAAEH